jgi:pyridoxamine 5'-phosphate oxidase
MSLFDDIRKEYQNRGLERVELSDDPFQQFKSWFQLALETCPGKWLEPNAMTLSTSANDIVTSRTVLLKDFDDRQLAFFTNYQSEKGEQLAKNPNAALLFHWAWQGRQIRIDGRVTKTNRAVSDKYFHSRPRASQISAFLSNQSSPLQSREHLEALRIELEQKLDGADVPLPDYWGGYSVTPRRWEFWQGREDRSHDRFRYSRDASGNTWTIQRLAP